MPYLDIEARLCDWFATLEHGEEPISTGTSTPENLAEVLPFLRIARIGGGDDKDNDYPRVSVQTYVVGTYLNPRDSYDLAEMIRDLLNDPPPEGLMLIDSSTTESGPVTFPWPDPKISCTQMIFGLTVRR